MNPNQIDKQNKGTSQNRLKDEKSPYLQQHATNPVNWYPWGDEAFEKAERENKPIFLSIGYSTCHWCHVMAHESFEDREVADLMNEHFVNIKVDREERPDIDQIYMNACVMMNNGHGGWPLTIIMTPSRRQPFFAATYIPKNSKNQRIGMLDLIPRIANLWKNEQKRLMNVADQITNNLRTLINSDVKKTKLENQTFIEHAYEDLGSMYDNQYGGFGRAPKFPSPHNLIFLLRFWYNRDNKDLALNMVKNTLSNMRLGGIYDHVGFGFHRYSTDREWKLPHFEKMLYDQALLILAYIEAFQVLNVPLFKQTVQEIISYVQRELKHPSGGFYTSQDADSEGEEGKFYVWSTEEIEQVLSTEEAELTKKVFNLQKDGNYLEEATQKKMGTNVLFLKYPLENIAKRLQMDKNKLKEKVEKIRHKLLIKRKTRIAPAIDDKILTDWNGLMIAALAKAGRVLNDKNYIEEAEYATAFILNNLQLEKNKLSHSYQNDGFDSAFLDDYSFFIFGLLELYESTFNIKYLRKAIELTNTSIDLFWDDKRGGFFFTAEDTAKKLIVRNKELRDGAKPSGNSIMLLNLVRLSKITSNCYFKEKANQLAIYGSGLIEKSPSGHTQFLTALDFDLSDSYELVVVGDIKDKKLQRFLTELQRIYLPNMVSLFKTINGNEKAISDIAPFTKSHTAKQNKPTVYLCQNYTCKLPSTNLSKILHQLKEVN